jgi:predicted lipid-binding transport protein (Tim44 family)
MSRSIVSLLMAGLAAPLSALAQASSEPSALPNDWLTLALIGAALAVLVIAALVLLRRPAPRRAGEHEFEHTYDGGYESVMPNPNRRREPSLNTIARAAGDERTDTVIAPGGVPADFDVPRFLRKSKAAFVRLQSSWDKGDLADIRRYTTRELCTELARQLKARGDGENKTEVVALGAELQGVETAGEYTVATVRFTGTIREAVDAAAAPFTEVWNLSKPLDGHRSWVIAKIQQY